MREALPILVLGLLAAAPAKADPTQYARFSASLEYSTYLDVHRALLDEEHAFGLRGTFAKDLGAVSVEGAVVLFPTSGLVASWEVTALFRRTIRRFNIFGGGGLGAFYTSEATFVPTFTDRCWGPTIQLLGAAEWQATKELYVRLGVGLYLLPLQPLAAIPVGVDLRWNVGAGWRF